MYMPHKKFEINLPNHNELKYHMEKKKGQNLFFSLLFENLQCCDHYYNFRRLEVSPVFVSTSSNHFMFVSPYTTPPSINDVI